MSDVCRTKHHLVVVLYMPSAVAEAEAAARYVADVWRLNAASRLQTQMESKRGTAPIKLNANGRLDNLLSAICRSSPLDTPHA